jgi:hypothetical protein
MRQYYLFLIYGRKMGISFEEVGNYDPVNPEYVKICGWNKCGRHATAC